MYSVTSFVVVLHSLLLLLLILFLCKSKVCWTYNEEPDGIARAGEGGGDCWVDSDDDEADPWVGAWGEGEGMTRLWFKFSTNQP